MTGRSRIGGDAEQGRPGRQRSVRTR